MTDERDKHPEMEVTCTFAGFTHDQFREMFILNDRDGLLYWKDDTEHDWHARAGEQAGLNTPWVSKIMFNYETYPRVHANWFFHKGWLPVDTTEYCIRHDNDDFYRGDRIENLVLDTMTSIRERLRMSQQRGVAVAGG